MSILGLRPANERRRYRVMPSPTGRAQTQNQFHIYFIPKVIQRRPITENICVICKQHRIEQFRYHRQILNIKQKQVQIEKKEKK